MSEEKHDPDAIDAKRGISTVVGTLGGVLSILVLLGVMLYVTRDTAPDESVAREAKLAELRAAETKAQTEYSWIDKTKGTVHLPIEVAIDKALADGLKLPATQPSKK